MWPVKYATMFHMANDSHLFHTAEQLEAEGFYPVEGNRWKRGEELYLPLYQGPDGAGSSIIEPIRVKYNPDNTINPYLSVNCHLRLNTPDPAFLAP